MTQSDLFSPTTAAPAPVETAPHLFRSFWIGGYESATHIGPSGERLDMIAGVEHDLQVDQDYALLRTMNIQTARDGLRWHLIDRGGRFDFSSFTPMLKAAIKHGIQVIWDVCHYGWPNDLDIFSPEFVDRFAKFSAAVARHVAEHTDEIPFYAPVNEISFFAWAASRDMMFPYAHGRDDEIKHQLIRAAIAGCEAIWAVDSRARFVYPEPVVHVLPPRHRPELAPVAAQHQDSQYEAWDMLAGKTHPDLGGHPKYLDIIGANYYHSNQWEVEGNGRLRWEDDPLDDRWLPFHKLLEPLYRRYQRPLFVAETSHFGIGRARWIREIAREVYQARLDGVPVDGICLYPILDRYDWADRNHWHNSGLWDFSVNGSGNGDGRLTRVLNSVYADEVRASQALLASIDCV